MRQVTLRLQKSSPNRPSSRQAATVTRRPIDRILHIANASTGLEGLQDATVSLRDFFGIRHVVYNCVDAMGDQNGFGTYSDAWRHRYIEQNYLRIDPIILGCHKHAHPLDWKRLDWTSKAARAFFKEAMSYGVGNQGYSVPIRGPNGKIALFTSNHCCSDDEWAGFIEKYSRDLLLIGHVLHRRALELEAGRIPEPVQPLSPREVDAITLIALGYNRAQVARSLSISEHTLRAYIESARFKLGASNTTHAVARALSLGLISI